MSLIKAENLTNRGGSPKGSPYEVGKSGKEAIAQAANELATQCV